MDRLFHDWGPILAKIAIPFMMVVVAISLYNKKKREDSLAQDLNERKKMGAPPVNEQEIIDQFQRNRKKGLTYGGIPLILGVLIFLSLILLLMIIKDKDIADMYALCLIVAGFIVFGCGAYILPLYYRCPVCDALPMALMWGGGGLGLMLDPESCPKCKVRLKKG